MKSFILGIVCGASLMGLTVWAQAPDRYGVRPPTPYELQQQSQFGQMDYDRVRQEAERGSRYGVNPC